MAKLAVVAVRDSALDAFLRPFFVPALGMATRSFADEVNRREGDMAKHPDDYELYQLGWFDESSGVFQSLEKPNLLVRGKDVANVS